MIWVRHLALLEEKGALVGKPEGQRQFRRNSQMKWSHLNRS